VDNQQRFVNKKLNFDKNHNYNTVLLKSQIMPDMLKFELPKNQSSLIKVVGVGGGGSNAVTHMYKQGIKGVDFILCNTDAQALETSPIPNKIQLGSKGLGAGSIPSVGKEAALENIEQIKSLLETNTKMLFITAGMGGGTGTGGAPVIASIAKELGILTVGIVTLPFSFEGNKRRQQAEQGVNDLRKHVDTLLVISNDKLRELYGNLKLSEAFSKADNILTSAAKGIAEIITVPGYINVDFEDVKTVMQDSGVAIMGTGVAEGEDRARTAVEDALNSPLLNDSNIKGANNILLYIASGAEEISMDEVSEITDFIQNESGYNAEIIWGNGVEESLENKISITIIATGFETNTSGKKTAILPKEQDRVIHSLEEVGIMEPMKTDEIHDELLSEITLINKTDESVTVISEPDNVVHEVEKTYTFDLSVKEEKEEKEEKELKDSENFKFYTDENRQETTNSKRTPLDDLSEVKEESAITENSSEIERRALERIKKLKDLSIKLKTPGGVAELENEPAYVRRKVELSETPSSSDSEVSKYTLSSDDESSTEIKTNNSFLSDNVD